MTAINTIVFDLGGVLINYSLERCIESFRQLGWAQADQLIDPYKQSGILLRLESGEITKETFYAEIIRAIGHPVAPSALDQALCSFLLDIPSYKLDMLLDLRRQGYRVYMLSNTNVIMMEFMKEHRFKVQGLHVDAYFDRLFLSYEMGLIKPYPEIYRKMIAQGAITPQQSLFIDDSAANIATASSLGFNTYQAEQSEDYRMLFSQYELSR